MLHISKIQTLSDNVFRCCVMLANEYACDVEVYQNPYHLNAMYLSPAIQTALKTQGKDLCDCLVGYFQKPLQIMVPSTKHDLVRVLSDVGFVKKRMCYEYDVSLKDLRQPVSKKVDIITIVMDDPEYDRVCRLLYKHYRRVHQSINALTATFDQFKKDLPKMIWANSNKTSFAFMEENEIAYYFTLDKTTYVDFLETVCAMLFERHQTIMFECDNTDDIAMTLGELFYQPEETYDTYQFLKGGK